MAETNKIGDLQARYKMLVPGTYMRMRERITNKVFWVLIEDSYENGSYIGRRVLDGPTEENPDKPVEYESGRTAHLTINDDLCMCVDVPDEYYLASVEYN